MSPRKARPNRSKATASELSFSVSAVFSSCSLQDLRPHSLRVTYFLCSSSTVSTLEILCDMNKTKTTTRTRTKELRSPLPPAVCGSETAETAN